MSAQPLDVRLASLEGSYHQVSDRLNSIDQRLGGLEQRMEGRFTGLDSKIDRVQWRMTALIVGTWISVIATILFHH